jgi:O-antigen/teichoic acid export membrane protein
MPLLLGDEWADATPSFTPAIAALPLAAAAAAVTQMSALRMRADVRVLSAAAGVAAFLVTSVVAVPALGAPGATTALLASVATVVAVGAARLGDAHGRRMLLLAYGGAAFTLLVGLA